MKNIQRLVLAKFLSSLCFTVPIQTLFFFAKGLKFSEVMLLESVLLVGILLFQIPTGIVADKIGRKWNMVCGSLVGLMGWIPWFFANGFPLFALSFFLFGVAIAFQTGSDQALIFDELRQNGREGDMQRVIGKYYASITLGTAIGALIGGYLAVSQDLSAFYFLYKCNVVMQVIGFVVFFTVHEPKLMQEGSMKEGQTEKSITLFLSGLHHLFTHRKLRRIFLLSIFTLPFSFVLIYIFQPYFKISGVSPLWYGTAVFIASLLSFGANMFAFKIEKTLGVTRGAFFVSILPGVIWLSMAVVFHPVFSVVLYILNTVAGNTRDPVFSDYLNRHIEAKNRATVLSTISLAGTLYAIMVRPLIGLLVDMDMRYGFVVMAALIVLGAVYFRIGEDDVTVDAQ